MLRRATVIWFLLAFLAVLNGAVRETFIRPVLGEAGGHVVSTLIFCAVIFLVAVTSLGWIGAASLRSAISIGILWVLLAVAFEFLAGHYLFGYSWGELFADYDVLHGRIWVLVPLSSLIAPVWAFGFLRRRGGKGTAPSP
jgi:hypothetical protein